MDRVLVILICTIILIAGVIGIIAGTLTNTNISSGAVYIPPYAGGKYFPMDNGTSKIYLINSTANYGVYSQDMSLQPGGNNIEAHAGDPCVIINGTLRNDYDKSYWIDLSAQLYDANGKPVGKVLTDAPTHYAGQVYAESNSTVNFSFTVNYNKKDVSRYDLSAWLAPGPQP